MFEYVVCYLWCYVFVVGLSGVLIGLFDFWCVLVDFKWMLVLVVCVESDVYILLEFVEKSVVMFEVFNGDVMK